VEIHSKGNKTTEIKGLFTKKYFANRRDLNLYRYSFRHFLAKAFYVVFPTTLFV